MHPLAETGPYYSTIVGPSAIETKGGPRTTVHGQILGADDQPVPGLYGVGNCVASPSGQAYLAGGSTFGPFITYGYLAAQGVVGEPVKEIGAAAVA
jgi:predicted oxidoreductase